MDLRESVLEQLGELDGLPSCRTVTEYLKYWDIPFVFQEPFGAPPELTSQNDAVESERDSTTNDFHRLRIVHCEMGFPNSSAQQLHITAFDVKTITFSKYFLLERNVYELIL